MEWNGSGRSEGMRPDSRNSATPSGAKSELRCPTRLPPSTSQLLSLFLIRQISSFRVSHLPHLHSLHFSSSSARSRFLASLSPCSSSRHELFSSDVPSQQSSRWSVGRGSRAAHPEDDKLHPARRGGQGGRDHGAGGAGRAAAVPAAPRRCGAAAARRVRGEEEAGGGDVQAEAGAAAGSGRAGSAEDALGQGGARTTVGSRARRCALSAVQLSLRQPPRVSARGGVTESGG